MKTIRNYTGSETCVACKHNVRGYMAYGRPCRFCEIGAIRAAVIEQKAQRVEKMIKQIEN